MSSVQQSQEGTIGTRSKTRLESFDVTEAMMGESTDELLLNTSISSNHGEHPHRTRARTRSIPVPVASSHHHPAPPGETASAASSQGSSGSAFLSAVLQPPNSSMLSHTPPVATSYENSHFGKRPRSGSVSGRLRSASEYLEEKGLLDRQTKGILKDLIIIGDEELQQALDSYEAGDPAQLEQMIQSGALQNRLPQDLDILGDLDLDFLTMDEDMGMSSVAPDQSIESLPNQHHVEKYMPKQEEYSDEQAVGALHALAHTSSKTITPNDDMVGDLEFAGEFVSDQTAGTDNYNGGRLQHHHYAAKGDGAASHGTSPGDESNALSEYEKRMRSNSLFSALLDPATRNAAAQNTSAAAAGGGDGQYGQWMDNYAPNNVASGGGGAATTSSNRPGGIKIGGAPKPRGRPKTGTSGRGGAKSGIAASLEADRKKREKEEKKRERQEKKKMVQEQKKAAAAASMEEDQEEQHIPGSGRPRSLSDPQLRYTLDEHGLQECERPDGWIGAYSPDSRAVRIGRFLEKRNHRVWTKTVKYDVRKNFADSRLRVKGRFVKKEDELMMRELMSLT